MGSGSRLELIDAFSQKFIQISRCKNYVFLWIFAQITFCLLGFFCLMIALVCSEGLAGMMVRSDFNRPFVKYLFSVKLAGDHLMGNGCSPGCH